MKLALNDELIRRNPVVDIEIPLSIHKEKRALTLEELHLLVEKCSSHQAMILTMGLMGLRIGEICALKASDVDLYKRELTVRNAMTIDSGYRRYESTTKTKVARTINIPNVVLELLEPLCASSKPEQYLFRGIKGAL